MTELSGTFSLGFNTNVFPQAMAIGYIHSGTIAGKLNGTIPAQTLTGWRMVSQSTSRAMFWIDCPMISDGTPQANSTTSMPRCTEARASTSVLPCSRVTVRAISSACCTSSSRNLKRKWQRCTTGLAVHSGPAAPAASITLFTSSVEQNGTLAITLPVEGLYTSPKRDELLLIHFPPDSRGTCSISVDDGAERVWVIGSSSIAWRRHRMHFVEATPASRFSVGATLVSPVVARGGGKPRPYKKPRRRRRPYRKCAGPGIIRQSVPTLLCRRGARL